jgi:hypothetical protein
MDLNDYILNAGILESRNLPPPTIATMANLFEDLPANFKTELLEKLRQQVEDGDEIAAAWLENFGHLLENR